MNSPRSLSSLNSSIELTVTSPKPLISDFNLLALCSSFVLDSSFSASKALLYSLAEDIVSSYSSHILIFRSSVSLSYLFFLASTLFFSSLSFSRVFIESKVCFSISLCLAMFAALSSLSFSTSSFNSSDLTFNSSIAFLSSSFLDSLSFKVFSYSLIKSFFLSILAIKELISCLILSTISSIAASDSSNEDKETLRFIISSFKKFTLSSFSLLNLACSEITSRCLDISSFVASISLFATSISHLKSLFSDSSSSFSCSLFFLDSLILTASRSTAFNLSSITL